MIKDLTAVNIYAERDAEHGVRVWFVVSRFDGHITAITYGLDEARLLRDAFADAVAEAERLDGGKNG